MSAVMACTAEERILLGGIRSTVGYAGASGDKDVISRLLECGGVLGLEKENGTDDGGGSTAAYSLVADMSSAYSADSSTVFDMAAGLRKVN